MWRDENKRPSVCHRSTRRKVSREMIMFAICICPICPILHFDRAAPPGVRLSNIWPSMWIL